MAFLFLVMFLQESIMQKKAISIKKWPCKYILEINYFAAFSSFASLAKTNNQYTKKPPITIKERWLAVQPTIGSASNNL